MYVDDENKLVEACKTWFVRLFVEGDEAITNFNSFSQRFFTARWYFWQRWTTATCIGDKISNNPSIWIRRKPSAAVGQYH